MDDLAAVFFDDSAPPEVREAVRPLLEKKVQSLQKRLLSDRNLWLPDEDEFLATAFQDVMQIAQSKNKDGHKKYDPHRRFQPWCRYWLTLRVRRRINPATREQLEFQGRLARAVSIDAVPVSCGGPSIPGERQRLENNPTRRLLEQAWFREETLPAADLRVIEDWPANVKPVLLIPSGLWGKLPEAMQVTTLDAAGLAERQTDEGVRSLVEHLASLEPERLVETQSKEFAEWLGMSASAFTRLFQSNRWRLFELTAFQDFVLAPQPGPNFFAELFAMARHDRREFQKADWILMESRSTQANRQVRAPAGWMYRCLLLAMSGLWKRLPVDLWPAWLESDALEAPFPPQDPAAGQPGEWDVPHQAELLEPRYLPMTAQALGNTFRQEQPRLLDLPSIARLVTWERAPS
jgi:hypothetical protein